LGQVDVVRLDRVLIDVERIDGPDTARAESVVESAAAGK
jgi:hypothetical protein